MRKKRIIMYGCMTALAVSMMTGCGKSDNASDGNSQVASQEKSDSGNQKEQGKPDEQDGSQMVQVTKVEEDTITAKVAATPEGRDGDNSGEKPQGTPPAEGEKPEGTPPADTGEGQKPEGTPSADDGKGQKDDKGGRSFQFSDETISIKVTSDTKITKGGRDNQEEASVSDIQENSILRVVLDDDNQAESIQIMEINEDDSNGESDNA